jgi:predicted DNA-binding transcriptional regulator AlpA
MSEVPHSDSPHPPGAQRSRPDPLLVRRQEAAALCGMSLATFDRADAAGLIPAGRKVGGCKVWAFAELQAWATHGCPPRSTWQSRWEQRLKSG